MSDNLNEKPDLEIERKFIIKRPPFDIIGIMGKYDVSDIVQIYLASEPGTTHRIRARSRKGETKYYETKKTRIDEMTVIEDEKEISDTEFFALAPLCAKGTHPIKKQRHAFYFKGHTVEIDIYPQWKNTCIMEIELKERDEELSLPPFITVLREVTGIKAYSNASMSIVFPKEEMQVDK